MRKVAATRWIGVAHRAAEFRALLGAAEVGQQAKRAQTSAEAHIASRQAVMAAGSRWRSRTEKRVFHTVDDSLFRVFQRHLHALEVESGERAAFEQEQLHRCETQLRQILAERDALDTSLQRARQRARHVDGQRAQKDADETWMLVGAEVSDED